MKTTSAKKSQKGKLQRSFTPEAQNRLIAYTAAAGLGAFAVTQRAEAQVNLSATLTPYPHTLTPGTGAGYYHTYFYLDVDGDSTPDFNLGVSNWRIDITPTTAGGHILNPSSNAYIIPWTVGTAIDSGGSTPTYKRWLATPNFNNFGTTAAMGFEFVSGLDNQTHFGYMDIQINGMATGIGSGDFTATVADIYWNGTPNQAITVQAVPEPSSLALLAAGVVGLSMRRKYRK